jgi:pyruvate kinase
MSDKIVLVAGLPVNSPNQVNTVRVLILGTVLARSSSGGCANPAIFRARGRIIHAATPQDARDRIRAFGGGEILVCRILTDDYIPILRIVNGVICEGVSEIGEQRLRDINPNIVWLTHIRRATQKLESGLTVTLDAKQLLVYEGSV